MKKLTTLVLCLAALLTVRNLHAQTELTDLCRRAADLTELVQNEYQQEVVRLEFDLISSTKSTYRKLYQGYDYGIVAFSDERIADIDIKIYKLINNEWVELGKDNTSDETALVTITPSYTGDYRIDITSYKFSYGYDSGYYGLLVYHN